MTGAATARRSSRRHHFRAGTAVSALIVGTTAVDVAAVATTAISAIAVGTTAVGTIAVGIAVCTTAISAIAVGTTAVSTATVGTIAAAIAVGTATVGTIASAIAVGITAASTEVRRAGGDYRGGNGVGVRGRLVSNAVAHPMAILATGATDPFESRRCLADFGYVALSSAPFTTGGRAVGRGRGFLLRPPSGVGTAVE